MIQVKNELNRLKGEFGFLDCIETGTIRSYHERHESTRHISNIIGRNGKLKSIDIEPNSIKISRDICGNADNVEWILSSSVDYLKKDNDQYQFILLDSINDSDYIFEEFELVIKRLVVNGSLMVDDAGVDLNKNLDSSPAVKGVKINQFLKDNGFDYSIVTGGHGTQILFRMTEEGQKKINNLVT